MTHDDLIARAEAVVHPRLLAGRVVGDVGAALETTAGDVYVGVSIDTASGTGFCAEHSAIAAMVTTQQQRIARIVAVWKGDDGKTVILPPCGRCREFIRQIDEGNLETEVIVGRDSLVKLRELLPYHDWPATAPD